jgi:integrase
MTRKKPGIYKRGATWTAHVHWTDRDGKPQQHKKGGFPTEQDARTYHAQYLTQIHTGQRSAARRVRLGDFLTREWLPQRQTELKATTYNSYKNVVESRIIPRIGHLRLDELTARRVEDYYKELQHPTDGTKGISPKTIANVAGVLKTAVRDAVRWELIAINPISEARRPRARRAEMKSWQPEQLGEFLAAASHHRQHAVWHLAATTGLRRGELCGLRWSDIDFDRRTLTVRNTRVVAGGTIYETTPKTEKGARTISLDKTTIDALRRLRAQQNAQQLAQGHEWRNHSGYVTVEEDGAPTHPQRISHRFKAICKKHQLPQIRLHDVRHSYVVAARRAGASLKTVSERVGHSDVTVTLKVYDHVFREDDSRAAEDTAELIYTEARERR